MLSRIDLVLIAFLLAFVRVTPIVTAAGIVEHPCPLDACDDEDYEAGTTGTFRGVYTLEFERSTFQPEDSRCEWWMDGEIDALAFTLGTGRSYEGASARVEVEGILSEPGRYGHRGALRRELRVSRVISAERKSGKGWTPLALKAPPTKRPSGPLRPEILRP